MNRSSISSLNFLVEKYTKDEINYYILRHTTIDSDYSINLIFVQNILYFYCEKYFY